LHVRISTASGSERDFGGDALLEATLATARGTDPTVFPICSIANRSNSPADSSAAGGKPIHLRNSGRSISSPARRRGRTCTH